MQDVTTTDVTMTHQLLLHENLWHENAGHKNVISCIFNRPVSVLSLNLKNHFSNAPQANVGYATLASHENGIETLKLVYLYLNRTRTFQICL